MGSLPLLGAGPSSPGWSPAALSPLAWYKPDASHARWKDTAGTLAAVNGDALARVDDLSGNGRHLLQATSSKRPLAAATCLTCDGVDDNMAAAFTLPQPFYRVSVVKVPSWVNATYDYLFDGASASDSASLHRVNANIRAYAGSALILTNWYSTWNFANKHLIVEKFDGASSSFSLDGALTVTGNPGASSPGGVTVGSQRAGANYSALSLHEMVLAPTSITSGDLALLTAYLTSEHGL